MSELPALWEQALDELYDQETRAGRIPWEDAERKTDMQEEVRVFMDELKNEIREELAKRLADRWRHATGAQIYDPQEAKRYLEFKNYVKLRLYGWADDKIADCVALLDFLDKEE